MGWGSLSTPQFEERLAAVRQAIQVHGPTDVAERLHAAVARSTAPLASLAGKKPLQVHVGAPQMMVQGGTVGYELGRYHKAGILGRPARIHLNVHPDHDPEEVEMTFMHELGHHASTLAGTGGSIVSRWNPRTRGAEEARADDFAHGHHQRDPQIREPDRRAEHSYEGNAAGLMTGRFKAGYQTERRTRLQHFHEGIRWGSG